MLAFCSCLYSSTSCSCTSVCQYPACTKVLLLQLHICCKYPVLYSSSSGSCMSLLCPYSLLILILKLRLLYTYPRTYSSSSCSCMYVYKYRAHPHPVGAHLLEVPCPVLVLLLQLNVCGQYPAAYA